MSSIDRSRRLLTFGGLAAGTLGSFGAALATETYPSRAVTLLVALQAGSGSDVATRVLGEHLGTKFGVPFVVNNVPGAGGVLGATRLAHSPADGYTFAALNNGLVCLVPSLPNRPSLDIDSLMPVGMIADLPSVLIVSPKLGVANLAEFVAASKKAPGRLSYGSVGAGSPQHVAMEMFKQSTGAQLLHVPYKGGPQAVMDVVADHIQATWIAIPVAAPLIRTGQVQALAVGSGTRSTLMPEVPTLAECGVTDFEYLPWLGLYAPPGTPATVVSRMNLAMQDVLKDPGVSATLLASGLEARPMSTADSERRGRLERQAMIKVVRRLALE